jgi:hypothetical protein
MFSSQKLLGRDEKFYDFARSECAAGGHKRASADRVVAKTRAARHTGERWSNSPTAGVRTNGSDPGIDPSRNFEILHLSISVRPFTAQGTAGPMILATRLDRGLLTH